MLGKSRLPYALLLGMMSFGVPLQAAMYMDQAALDAADEFAANSMFDPVVCLFVQTADGWYPGSGVVIDSHWILTAGHMFTLKGGISDAVAYSGLAVYSGYDQKVNGTAWYSYPGYVDGTPVGHGSDIGLLYVEDTINVIPALLFGGEDVRGTLLYAAGYGAPGTVAGGVGEFDGVKRAGRNVGEAFGDDPPWVFIENQYWMSYFQPLYDTNKQPLEWQSTPGDSGGGYFADIDGQLQLVGINSGIYGLQGNGYSVGVRTSLYYDWINDTMASTAAPEPSTLVLLAAGALGFILFSRPGKRTPRRSGASVADLRLPAGQSEVVRHRRA